MYRLPHIDRKMVTDLGPMQAWDFEILKNPEKRRGVSGAADAPDGVQGRYPNGGTGGEAPEANSI